MFVEAVPVFQHQLWQQSCHRKQIIIIMTERSTDNTKEQHWHINTVPGHHVITVYRPVSAQLPPLRSSIISTPSRAEAGTLTVWVTSYHLTIDIFLRYCLFNLNSSQSWIIIDSLVFQRKTALLLIISVKISVLRLQQCVCFCPDSQG